MVAVHAGAREGIIVGRVEGSSRPMLATARPSCYLSVFSLNLQCIFVFRCSKQLTDSSQLIKNIFISQYETFCVAHVSKSSVKGMEKFCLNFIHSTRLALFKFDILKLRNFFGLIVKVNTLVH